MFRKKLLLILALFIAVLFIGNTLAYADNLADVQKKIKEKGLKWVAEKVPDGRGLGLLEEPYSSEAVSTVAEGQVQTVVLPGSLDWRNVGADNLLGVNPGVYVTPVKDQGNCGSCWAFATTATAESTTHISLNAPINILDPSSDYDLSELDMLNCSGAGNCPNGGYITTASNYIKSPGLLQEKPAGCYAYSPAGSRTPYSYCPNPATSPACDQNRYKIDSWAGVSATVDSIRNALNMYGPLVITFSVLSDFYNNYSSGIYEATSCDAKVNPSVGGHAVSVVGYQDADATHPIGYFIVKNSWGTWWGETAGGTEKGYFRIAYSQVGNCVNFGGSTLAYSKASCSGSIAVTSPTSSYTWQAGSSHDIRWSATGSIGQYVKIDLYQGSTFIKNIQASTPVVNGFYTWVVDSNLAGANYVIVVTSTACGSVSGASGYFTITAVPTFGASGLVTSATSGAGLSGVTMTFSRVSGTGTVPANVTTNAGGIWSQTGFQAGTSYRVTPSLSVYTFTPASSTFSDESTGLNFLGTAPTPASITVTYPNGPGLSFRAGSIVMLTWQYTGNPGSKVKLELLRGSVSSTIISTASIGSGGNGSYSWRINRNQTAGSTYKIRITSTSNSSATDTGDNTFTISK
jgi:hypothetical protein